MCFSWPKTSSFFQPNGVKGEVAGPEKYISKRLIEKVAFMKDAFKGGVPV